MPPAPLPAAPRRALPGAPQLRQWLGGAWRGEGQEAPSRVCRAPATPNYLAGSGLCSHARLGPGLPSRSPGGALRSAVEMCGRLALLSWGFWPVWSLFARNNFIQVGFPGKKPKSFFQVFFSLGRCKFRFIQQKLWVPQLCFLLLPLLHWYWCRHGRQPKKCPGRKDLQIPFYIMLELSSLDTRFVMSCCLWLIQLSKPLPNWGFFF